MTSVVWITGALGGLGSATARHLADAGRRLVLADLDASKLDDFAAALGADAVTFAGDIADPAVTDQAAAKAIDQWGRLDAVVHTAGGDLREWHNVLDYPMTAWQRCVDMNLTGSFNVVRAAGRAMSGQDPSGGHIALVGSGTAMRPTASNVGYAASKAGMIGLMRAASMDLAAQDIKVNLIFPGLTLHTGIHLRDDPVLGLVPIDEAYGAAIDKYKASTVLGRLSTPEDFAHNVAHLLSTAAISGQILNYDSRLFY